MTESPSPHSSGKEPPFLFPRDAIPQIILMWTSSILFMACVIGGQGLVTNGSYPYHSVIFLPLGVLACLAAMFRVVRNGVAPRPFSSSDFVEAAPFLLSAYGLAASIWLAALWALMATTAPESAARLVGLPVTFCTALIVNLRMDRLLTKHGAVKWDASAQFLFFSGATKQVWTTFVGILLVGVGLLIDFAIASFGFVFGLPKDLGFSSTFTSLGNGATLDNLGIILTFALLSGALFILSHLRLAMLDAER